MMLKGGPAKQLDGVQKYCYGYVVECLFLSKRAIIRKCLSDLIGLRFINFSNVKTGHFASLGNFWRQIFSENGTLRQIVF